MGPDAYALFAQPIIALNILECTVYKCNWKKSTAISCNCIETVARIIYKKLCVLITTVATRSALRSAASGDLLVLYIPVLTRQPGILRRWSDSVEQFASEHPYCTDTIYI